MPYVNKAEREINCKIVYYGPGMCGKTTNLLYIHNAIKAKHKNELITLSTEGERTIFFDFLPLETTIIQGFTTRFQLYTIPGQVFYNATRRIILQGVDGLVFVADSAWDKQKENVESFNNLKENLSTYNLQLRDIPYVVQYNKRDLPKVAMRPYMEFLLNNEEPRVPSFDAVATTGQGIFDTLNAICSLVLKRLLEQYG